MKKVGLLLTVALFSFGIMTTQQSCKNECKDVVCENGGTCDEETGDCNCVEGYDGANCETEFRAEMLDTFNVSDVVTSIDNPGSEGTWTYESTVAAGSSIMEITFSNFGSFGSTIKGVLTDTNSGTISSQTDAAGRKFTGTFATSGSDLTVDYTVEYTDATTDDGACTFSAI